MRSFKKINDFIDKSDGLKNSKTVKIESKYYKWSDEEYSYSPTIKTTIRNFDGEFNIITEVYREVWWKSNYDSVSKGFENFYRLSDEYSKFSEVIDTSSPIEVKEYISDLNNQLDKTLKGKGYRLKNVDISETNEVIDDTSNRIWRGILNILEKST